MSGHGNTDRAIRPDAYPYKTNGRTMVKCRECGNRGLTSKRFVGRAKTIDQCGDCKRRTQ